MGHLVLMKGDAGTLTPLNLTPNTAKHCAGSISWQVSGGFNRDAYLIAEYHGKGIATPLDGEPVQLTNSGFTESAWSAFVA